MGKETKKTVPAKWEPLVNDMISFKRSLDQQFENFFSGHPLIGNLPSIIKKEFTSWKPEIDMYETPRDVVVKANIPGCDRKDVKVNVEGNVLRISGEKKEEKETKRRDFYHKEQRMGSFSRSVSLPLYADLRKPKATYDKGVLKVEFPKTAAARSGKKQIEIRGT